MLKKLYIDATLNEMSAPSDVIRHIGRDRYDAIKRDDKHPMFILLRVGYEGISRGSVTIGSKTHFQDKRWSRDAIEEMATRLNEDPGVFVGDHGDRGKPGRQRKGDVLSGHVDDDDDGKRSALAVAYITDLPTREMIKSGELNVCSVEGEIVLAVEKDLVVVETVKRISGVVISNGSIETPGFERAGIEAVVAEMSQTDPFLKDNPLDRAAAATSDDPFLNDNPLGQEV